MSIVGRFLDGHPDLLKRAETHPLDALFGRAYKSIFHRSHGDFEFSTDVQPLSQPWIVVLTIIVYLVGIKAIQNWQAKQPKSFAEQHPILKSLVIVHNAFLCGASLIVLVLILENGLPKLFRHGFHWSICNLDFYDSRLRLFIYINYMLKYYELLDTVFLALSKKPLEFLHVYHHAATLALCYTQMLGTTSAQWVPITINLTVHVIMYYYYARAASGAIIWWKKYLTTFQIIQFVIDFNVCWYLVLEAHIVDRYLIPKGYMNGPPNDCGGTWWAAYGGCLILSSYLLLFIQFFKQTYKDRSRGREAHKSSKTDGKATETPKASEPANKGDKKAN